MSSPGLLIWLAAVVFWLTWAPFLPAGSGPEWSLQPPTNPVEIALNLVLLAPLGLVIGFSRTHGPERAPTGRGAVVTAVVVGAVVSCAAEAGQILIVGRSPSAYDVVLNVVGAGVAARIARRLGRRGWLGSVGPLLTVTHLYLAALVYLFAMSSFHAGGHRLERWVDDFRIRAGQEVGGTRRYAGTVREAEICAGPADDRLCGGPGADPATRRRLVSRAMESQRVTLRAEVTATSQDQSGPARIVTFSDGVLQRNATLGQTESALVLRLRTPLAGPNGSDVDFTLPEAVPVGVPTRVEGEYDRGRVTLRARSGGTVREKSASYPLLLWTRVMAWQVDRPVPFQVRMASILGLVILFLPPGLVAAAVGRSAAGERGGLPARVPWLLGLVAAAALYAILLARLAVPFRPEWLVAALATVAAGEGIGALGGHAGQPGGREAPTADAPPGSQ